MAEGSVQPRAVARFSKRMQKFVSGSAAVALLSGMLVVAGIGVQSAIAAGPPAPEVNASVVNTPLWGEDVTVRVTLKSPFAADDPGNNDAYNLSLGIVLPEGVTPVGNSTLGVPTVYPLSSSTRIIPGVYARFPSDCVALGLEPVSGPGYACQVPEGMKYAVYTNISDLPAGASTQHELTVRPDAKLFPIGSTLNATISAFTSNSPTLIPVFPGTKTLAASNSHTSTPGTVTLEAPVKGLRVSKAQTEHPDNKVLRGVHGGNGTVYRLTIDHTGEANLDDAEVVDFLPAGIEYLGSCGIKDHSSNANGTSGSAEEYPEAGPLNTATVGENCLEEHSVETILMDAETAAKYANASGTSRLEVGKVYTKVTWKIPAGIWDMNSNDSGTTPQAQPADVSGQGIPATTVIRYRAGVPLFENTLDFGGTAPDALSGEQGANLDNNRGASTRHGDEDPADPTEDKGDGNPQTFTNVAVANGSYDGADTSDWGSHSIEAVDLRVIKSVNDSEFKQGGFARYTLHLATSEYTSAEVPSPNAAPYRLFDDFADGLCPVFPANVEVAHDPANPLSTADNPVPNLVFGKPQSPSAQPYQTAEDWNAALTAAGLGASCAWNPSSSNTQPQTTQLEGAKLSTLGFDSQSGHFYLELAIDPALLEANSRDRIVRYSAEQGVAYVSGSEEGATTSGDTVYNAVDIFGKTTSIPALENVTSAGSTVEGNIVSGDTAAGVWNASDDSSASLKANYTKLSKTVLSREGGVPDAADIAKSKANGGPDPSLWVKKAVTPFAPGDEVWYRVQITPPSGTDVRNPKFTDFLPEGVEFDGSDNDGDQRPDNMWIVPSAPNAKVGTCEPENDLEWVQTFAPTSGISIDGNALTFTLGNSCGLSDTDRFLPLNSKLEIYLKVKVTDISAFGEVDLPQNLAKYQQNNVDGEIYFLRDEAEIALDTSARLVKGIESNNYIDPKTSTQPYLGPQAPNSNVDGQPVVQGNGVTFRLDITAPAVNTKDYWLYDALPEGVRAEHLSGYNSTTHTFNGSSTLWADGADLAENAPAFTAHVYNPGDDDYPTDLNERYRDRSIVVWHVSGTVPGSTPEIPEVPADPSTPGSTPTPAVPAVQRGFSVRYTVEVPGEGSTTTAAQITQDYINTASIAQMSVVNNSGASTSSALVPTLEAGSENVPTGGSTLGQAGQTVEPVSNRVAGPDQIAVSANHASDISNVTLPNATVTKTLISTEVKPTGSTPADPNNSSQTSGQASARPDNAIVEGEYATFEYAATIPAKTSVAHAELFDAGVFARGNASLEYEFVANSAKFYQGASGTTPISCGTGANAFICDEATGKLTLPEFYTNNTAQEQVFRVQITVWTPAQKDAVTLAHGNTLTNTAHFRYDKPTVTSGAPSQADLTATAVTRYVDPLPTLQKEVEGTQGAEGRVTFKLTAGNTTGRPALYDAVVYDCLPAGFTLPQQDFTPSAGTVTNPFAPVVKCSAAESNTNTTVTIDPNGTGTLIKWNIDRIDAGAPATLSFDAIIDPGAAGGESYLNRARIEGQTLPDASDRSGTRSSGASRLVEIASATQTKSVSPTRAPVGETVTYTLTTQIPAHANYYFFEIEDKLPAGVEFVTDSASLTFVDGPTIAAQPKVAGTVAGGQTLTWPAQDRVTIHTSDDPRTIVITYRAKIRDTIVSTAPQNSVSASWNVNPTTDVFETRKKTPNATANVTILNPMLSVAKQVKLTGEADAQYRTSKSGNPDQGFTYRVRVSNTGNTPAYHAAITDCMPAGVVGVTSVSHQGSYSATAAAGCANGTITWTDLGPIPAGGYIDLNYQAKFAPSAELRTAANATNGVGLALTNTAKVVEFTSYGTGSETGWTYRPGGKMPGGAAIAATIQSTAQVTPNFPHVVPTKTVSHPVAGKTYGLAHPGENFGWTLTLRNQGAGVAKNVSVTDVLPVNWEYVGNARISINGAASVELAGTPQVSTAAVTGGNQQTITWSEAQIAAAGGTPLGANRSIVITFDAKPTREALTTPGTGVIGNASKVSPHTNTLRATATDTTDATRNATLTSYVGPQSQATAYIGEADLTLTKTRIPTSPVVAGNSNVDAWKLVVENDGPDAAEGPITVKDTTGPLPEGITVAGATGDGWSCTVGPRAANGATEIDCARTVPTQSLASGQSFPQITVRVNVAASQLPTTVQNSAIVIPGATYDPNYVSDKDAPGYASQNNRSEATLETTTFADLTIVKTVTSPVQIPAAGVVVGTQLTWQLAVSNLGPSDSQSPDDTPITITDEVPTGIANVADPSNGSWSASVTRSGAAAQFPAQAGDIITWTYLGASLPLGSQSTVSMTGTILTSYVGSVQNTARVIPGATPEPPTAPDNNTSTVTTPTDDSTVIEVRKSRVVPDANAVDGWRQADPSTNPSDAFVAGSPVYYRVTVQNSGAADARNVHVVDEAPDGIFFSTTGTNPVNLSGTWTPSAVAQTNWHDFALQGGSIPAGEARSFVVSYETETTVVGAVVNWVEATADNAPSDRDRDSTDATKIVDLGIEKRHEGTGPFTPGTTVTYTLTVTNHGPSSTSGDIEIVDSLPVGLSYVSGSATASTTATSRLPLSAEPAQSGAGNRTLTWNLLEALDVFDVGQTVTVSFDVTIDPALRAGSSLTNVATVEGPDDQTEPDPDPHPNRATDEIITTGISSAMKVEKQVQNDAGDWVDSAQKVAGTVAKWRITVTNEGPSAAAVSFSDVLPAGASFVSISGDGWTCTENDGVPTGACTYTANHALHPVGADNATTIEIETLLAPELRPTQDPSVPALVNTGRISWSDDIVAGVQSASDTASVTIVNDADLSLVKQVITEAGGDVVAEPAAVTAGERVWYRLQVANLGTSDASGPVVVTDTLPIGITVPVGSSTVNGWVMDAAPVAPGDAQIVTFTLAGGQVAATAADANRGNAPVIEFVAEIDPTIVQDSVLVNTATVTSATSDSRPENNTDDASVQVSRSADLEIVKSHPVADEHDRVVIGDPLPFTIEVTNHGPSLSSGFTVTDTMPLGFEVTDQLGAVLDENDKPTGWTIESITPDQWDATQQTVVVASYLGETEVGQQAAPLVLNTVVHESAFSEVADGVVNLVAITAANEADPVPENNEAKDPILVRPLVTLVIDKQAVGEFKVGKVGTYSITVENKGPHPDHGPITVTDSLPAGLSYRESPDLPEGVTVSHEGGIVTWTLTKPLAVDGKVTLTLSVNVLQAAYEQPNHQLVNVAEVTTESSLTEDSVLIDDATVTVKPADPLVNTGAEVAGGLLAAIALMALLGGASYLAGRKRTRARHG